MTDLAALKAEISATEKRLSLVDSLIPKAEQPLHELWELRRQEQDLLLKLRRRLATEQACRPAEDGAA